MADSPAIQDVRHFRLDRFPHGCDDPFMADQLAQERHDPRVLALKAGLLVLWATVSFGFCFFAHDLQFMLGGWPFGYWMAAQGAVLVFIGIVALYAHVMARLVPEDGMPGRASNPDA